jgi:hypothetical protein
MMATSSIDSNASNARSISWGLSLSTLATKQRVPPFLKKPFTAWARARPLRYFGLSESGISGSSAGKGPKRLVYSVKFVQSLVS